MVEFCKFILTLNFIEWLKLMGTFLVLAIFAAGVVEDIGANFGQKEVKTKDDN